jgi:hypothetical protein
MDVVGHQAIGVERARVQLQALAQHGEIHEAIVLLPETVLAVVSAMTDVQCNAGEYEARMSCHAGTTPELGNWLTVDKQFRTSYGL